MNDATALYASMGLSSISSIIGTIEQVSSYRAQSEIEQSIARTNAMMARIQAKQVKEAGDFAVSKKDMQTKGAVASLLTAQGASGIDVNSASSLITRAQIEGAGVMDELTIRNNAARQAWGFETEAIQSSYKGQFARFANGAKAQQSILTGGINALSRPLGIYSMYPSERTQRYVGDDRVPYEDARTS